MKKYITPSILSILLILLWPGYFLLLMLAGDSCCGEDTSVAMIIFTLIAIFLNFIAAAIMNLLVKAVNVALKKDFLDYNLFTGILITGTPASLVYTITVIIIIISAFHTVTFK